MPQYIIFRKKGGTWIAVGLTENVRSVRAAFSMLKRTHKRKLHKGWQYHIFPINHARFWDYTNKKWRLDSWYGNHNKKEYRKMQQEFSRKKHDRMG